MTNIFSKFSQHSKSAIRNAIQLAKKLNVKTVEAEHILFGIAQEKGSLGYEILKQINMKEETLSRAFEQEKMEKAGVEDQENADKKPMKTLKESLSLLSLSSQRLLEKAMVVANLHNHRYIGTEHLLFGIIDSKDHNVANLLKQYNIDPNVLREKVHMVLKSTSKFPDLTDAMDSFRAGE